MSAPDSADPRVFRGASAVLAVAEAADDGTAGGWELPFLEAAGLRGYFMPDEDDAIRLRYAQYLASRAALLSVLAMLEPASGRSVEDWSGRRPVFAVALAAAFLIVRNTRSLVAVASGSRLLRKKLDESDSRHGIPAETFARLYRAGTDPSRLARLDQAARWLRGNRRGFKPLESDPLLGPVLALLDRELADYTADPSTLLRDRFRYRWFSFRRHHHSAWKQTVFELFRWSGSLIAEMHQPGIKPADAPKRVTPGLRAALLRLARPGDVFVTRHDDALSNLFLPGFWPHAALHLGTEADRDGLGLELSVPLARQAADPVRFLEAKKDGVRLRPPDDTLEVDALIILRPALAPEEIAAALRRAIGHAGKPYDFVFDFRRSDRLACTEVIYRAYHGCGPLSFELREVGGRLCLPAEELIAQSLEQGFRVVASCGIGAADLLTGRRAELALHASRSGL